ncbi:EAL domain-containing protein [Devosia sp. XJ19-1]|uniref:EAL domain-containing protein n=1 Tax=Devosia ureilytica TaxID=2952754 RepID=A0A9Q4AMF4_9HYPH|nr:EAL domain-containing protein [Devosia ureilytica]MCP8882828.1 EAL domain-containing protein [Devosia ureilytica]MCP8886804.1 EAL domain-containing protein [Devosia ureilytica]
MFEAASKVLPPVDYVSMIRSLYADRRSMLLGAFGSAVAAVVAALESESPILAVVAAVFVLVGSIRYLDMRAFDKITLADEDVETAQYWEMRATIGAAAIALLYGTWCMISFWIVDDAFAELTAACVSVSVLVGPAQRNFAIDRLMTTQVLLIAGPLVAGLLLVGNIYYALLTLLLLPFFISLRTIAGNSRKILLRAVHGRIEAAALANQLDAALDTLEHGLLMLDRFGVIEVVNSRALDAFGRSNPDAWLGQPFAKLCGELVQSGHMSSEALDQLNALIDAGSTGKMLLISASNNYYEVTVSSRDNKVVLLLENISDRVAAEERINYMARYDALTELPNRGYFAEQVAEALVERASDPQGHAALFVIDVDDFKHINDTMGHMTGDRLLVAMGKRLRETLGQHAICARLGGDEFVAFYPYLTGPDEARDNANRLLGAMASGFDIPGRHITVSISVGAVAANEHPSDLEELMIKADLALYEAKSAGKGQVVFFHDRMDTEYQQRQQLKADLRKAIDEGELSLVYQPLINPRENRIVGCEALARWTHPTLGPISPADFIPIAEETGMISDLTRYVLNLATHDCMTWPKNIMVAVNISARDFRSRQVETMVMDALSKSGLPPSRLEIEVTETTVIDEQEAAEATLHTLQAMGIGIALDDFGTGYSSLSYLRSMPFTKLKIDRSFVADIETDSHALRLLANVAQLGQDLALKITVEGVETEGQLALITEKTNVDLVQGFLYGRPLSNEALTILLSAHNPAPPLAQPLRIAAK